MSSPANTASTIDTEVAIIGGGIAGCSTALYLARLAHDVTVLEFDAVASQASGVNMGGIGGGAWTTPPDLDSYLRRGSVDLFQELAIDLGHDIELRLSGDIQAIQTEAEYQFVLERQFGYRAENANQSRRSRGASDAELLDMRTALSLEPGLNPALAGVVHLPRSRGQADPRKTTAAFASAARDAGATVIEHAPVGRVSRTAGGFALVIGGDRPTTLTCQRLILAAGCWSRQLAAQLDAEVPVFPVRGQMWATKPLPPCVFHTIYATESPLAWSQIASATTEPPALTHDPADPTRRRTRHLYGRQNAAGEVIFGGDRNLLTVGADWTPGAGKAVPDPDGIIVNQQHASEILPFLSQVPIARTWAGYMPFSIDGKPVIGALPGAEGAYIVGGLASSGFGRGPMAGKLLAELVHTGHPAAVLTEADPARFAPE